MNKIKYFGVICLAVLFFTSSGDAQQSFQSSLNFCLSFPQGKFKNNVDGIGLGGTGHFAYHFPRSSISVGAHFGILVYGRESRTESFSTQTLDFDLNEVTTNMIFMCHFLLRIQPQKGIIRPYLDGLIGFNYIWTDTSVKSHRYGETHNIAISNIQNDLVLSGGTGGGVMIRVYSKKRKKRNNPFVIYIDLGAHYVWSKEAEYMKEGSIHLENDQVLYDIYKSTTDLLTGHIGFTFAF
jgi:hypothetical protein